MTTPSTPHSPQVSRSKAEIIGDDHVGTSLKTPMRENAFDVTDEEKMAAIAEKFRDIMDILGLDEA